MAASVQSFSSPPPFQKHNSWYGSLHLPKIREGSSYRHKMHTLVFSWVRNAMFSLPAEKTVEVAETFLFYKRELSQCVGR